MFTFTCISIYTFAFALTVCTWVLAYVIFVTAPQILIGYLAAAGRFFMAPVSADARRLHRALFAGVRSATRGCLTGGVLVSGATTFVSEAFDTTNSRTPSSSSAEAPRPDHPFGVKKFTGDVL